MTLYRIITLIEWLKEEGYELDAIIKALKYIANNKEL